MVEFDENIVKTSDEKCFYFFINFLRIYICIYVNKHTFIEINTRPMMMKKYFLSLTYHQLILIFVVFAIGLLFLFFYPLTPQQSDEINKKLNAQITHKENHIR